MTDVLPAPDPLVSLEASTEPAPVNDTWTVRIVVIAIAIIVAGALIALTVLLSRPVKVDDGSIDSTWLASLAVMGSIATTGLGALAGLLASTASRRT